jgi:hypothetical protein
MTEQGGKYNVWFIFSKIDQLVIRDYPGRIQCGVLLLRKFNAFVFYVNANKF